jgi:hypothetical protein
MSKYKIEKTNVGFGKVVYTINRIDSFKDHFSGLMITDLIPVQPIKYFKTLSGAQREVKRLESR